MTSSITHLGGIIAATAAAVDADPAKAGVVFEASATAHDAVASTITLGGYHVEVDEPPPLGGEGAAPNPVEYYLASLLSCQIVTWRFWAEKLGIAVDKITARAEGDLDVRGFFGLDEGVEPVRAGFQQVRVVVSVSGPEAPERYRELQDAVDAHCPVLDLTRNPTPVVTRVEVG